MKRTLVLCFAVLAACEVSVSAEPIVFGTAQLSTSGVFSCRPGAVCSASGNTAVVGSGDTAITLTFKGVTNESVPISNTSRPVVLGFLQASGGSFPTQADSLLPIVNLNLTLAHSSPVADTASRLWAFGPGPWNIFLPLVSGSTFFTLNPGAVPRGYGPMIYTVDPASVVFGQGHIISLTGNVGVTPEPGTIALLGLGLAGAVRFCGKQRRTRESH